MKRTVRQRYRAELNPAQEHYMNALLGAVRATYNAFLSEMRIEYQRKLKADAFGFPIKTSTNDIVSKVSAFKNQPEERQWLRKYSAWTIQQAANEAKKSYEKWWSSKLSQKKPHFKRKKQGRSSAKFFCPSNGFVIEKLNKKHSRVWLGKKVGWVKFRDDRENLPENATGLTLIREPSGKHYLSFVCEQKTAEPKTEGNVTAVDLGLIDLLAEVSTSGERSKTLAARHKRVAEKKLKKIQRVYSRKQRGSRNQEKARKVLARAHERVANVRKDQHNKIAHRLACENQAVVFEDLAVSGLAKTRLAYSINDAGWGSLVNAVKVSCQKQGAEFIEIDRYAPTSRVCSQCGINSGKKPLGIRTWQCVHCSASLDRDYNAAVNIMLAAGMSERVNACGGDVRQLALVSFADPVEAGTQQETVKLTA